MLSAFFGFIGHTLSTTVGVALGGGIAVSRFFDRRQYDTDCSPALPQRVPAPQNPDTGPESDRGP